MVLDAPVSSEIIIRRKNKEGLVLREVSITGDEINKKYRLEGRF
jgi:hypothetical protein